MPTPPYPCVSPPGRKQYNTQPHTGASAQKVSASLTRRSSASEARATPVAAAVSAVVQDKYRLRDQRWIMLQPMTVMGGTRHATPV